MSFAGKVVLVTGASRGIGAATAKAFATAGAKVALGFSTDWEGAEATAHAIRETGGTALLASADLTDAAAILTMANKVESELGPVDVLVNNAGVVLRTAFLDTSLEDLDRLFAVNFRALFILSQRVARGMVARKRGAIVSVSSVAGHLPLENRSHYSASKGAVDTLTKVMALELGPLGVRVNAVAPGWTETEMAKRTLSDPNLRQRFQDSLPMGRLADPTEVAAAILFLASDQASYINGQILSVDGGTSARQSIPKL